MARTGAAMVLFEVVGSFQASNMLKDAKAQMNILNAIVLNGLGGIYDATVDAAKQITALVDATVPLAMEVANARIQFEKFMGDTENLDEVTQEIINMGTSFGFTADKALEAGAKMAQLKDIVGGSQAVGAATEVGIKFALIGDMETEAAMQRLINLQQQTNFMFKGMTAAQIEAMDAESRAMLVHKNSMQVLTQLNTVENNSAATMEQLTFIMNQFAAQADMTGESISGMAAQAAVLVEAGEEMGKAGRALRMIYARLGADTNANNDALAAAGVAVHDAEGNLRPLSEIVNDLAANFKNLSLEEQQQIAQLVAGNDHYVRFLKLVQGAERAQRLQTMANLGLSDAQDEVNLKLRDQSNELRRVQAELENAKAKLGDALIPAQIAATRSQVSFNRAMETFYTMQGTTGEKVFGGLIRFTMDAAFHFERVHKVMGPIIEAMLNIKSLSVAIQTQQTIMRSLQGEQLMNPAYYKNVAGHQANIANDTMEEYKIRLRMQGAKSAAFSISQMEVELESQQIGLAQQQLELAAIRNQEGVALNAIENERFQIYNEIGNAEQRLIDAREQSLSQAQQNLSFLHAEAAMKNQLTQQELDTLEMAIPLERQRLMNSFMALENARNQAAVSRADTSDAIMTLEINEYNLDIIKKMFEIRGMSQEAQQRVLEGMGQEMEVREALYNQAVAELTILEAKQEIEKLSPAYTDMVQRVAQTKLMNIEALTELELKQRLLDLDQEEMNVLQNLIPNANLYNQLTEKEITLLQELLPLMREMNITDEQSAQIAFDAVRAKMAHGDSMKATGIQAGMAQQQMMKYSAAVGGASMFVGLFDKSTQGAKVSMMLMTPVMIASTVQMMMMTAAMMKSTQVKLADTAATVAQTTATTGFVAATRAATAAALSFAASTGGMLIIVGAVVAGLYAMTNSAEDNAESIIRMNGALTESVSILTDLQNMSPEDLLADIPTSVADAAEVAGVDLSNVLAMSQTELQSAIQLTKQEIKELTKAADDGSTLTEQAFQKELEAANKFLGALEAQKVALQANAILAGDFDTAYAMSVDNAIINAKEAIKQFSSDEGIKSAYEDIDMFGFGTSDYVKKSQESARDAAASILKAYEQETGRQLSRGSTEDLIEMLADSSFASIYGVGGTGRGRLGHAATRGADSEFVAFVQGLELSQKELAMLSKALDDSGDATDETVDSIMKSMGKLDFNMTADEASILADIFEGLGQSASSGAGAGLGELAGQLEGVNEQLFEFNNNREAMFFGFSQAGVTGDFVKQVQQKGVENLIANTELIVNNTFNGMSLPEMVEQVTDGVVERLVAAGVVQEGAYS